MFALGLNAKGADRTPTRGDDPLTAWGGTNGMARRLKIKDEERAANWEEGSLANCRGMNGVASGLNAKWIVSRASASIGLLVFRSVCSCP